MMKNEALLIQNVFIETFEEYIKKGYNNITSEIIVEDDFNKLESININLINKKIDRVLFFKFQAYNGPNKEFVAEFVWFSIKKMDNTSIRLADYWRKKKGEDSCIVSLINQIKGQAIEERLVNYFNIVKSTLEKELLQVIEGNEWINVPFDWHGYNK